MPPVHFRWGRGILWLRIGIRSVLFLLSLIAVAFLLRAVLAADDWGTRALGLLWIGVFGWLTSLLVRSMRPSEPVVTVDAAGLHDRRIASSAFLWNELRGVEVETTNFQGFWGPPDDIHMPIPEPRILIGLEFADPRASLRKARWSVRLFAPVKRLMGHTHISIDMAHLHGSAEDLLAAVCAHRPDLIVKGRADLRRPL